MTAVTEKLQPARTEAQLEGRTKLAVRTPEGLDLHFQVASIAERFVAVSIDLMLVATVLGVVSFVLGMLFGASVPLLSFFFIRHGYFLWFETRGSGRTFGKRRLHLRVIRADGGPLTMEIMLARNLTREVEFFLPLILLLAPDALFADHQGIVRLLASLWVLVPLSFPFFHPQRMRLGDLLAGTRVVVAPPVAMLSDLADHSVQKNQAVAAVRAQFAFTTEQLEIYGEHELSVLEDLLRKSGTVGGRDAMRAATRSIGKRIGFVEMHATVGNEKQFLQAFYSAQRAHLEQRLLFGKRRFRKDGKRK